MIQSTSRENRLGHPLRPDLTCPVLQYADDTLVILQACPTQLTELKSVLKKFSTI